MDQNNEQFEFNVFVFQIHTDWPSYIRSKGVFFIKREMEPIPEVSEENTTEELVNNLTCGDIHPNALGLFKTFLG